MLLSKRVILSVVAVLALLPLQLMAESKTSISADYQIKASFFALPMNSKIKLERLGENVFQASVKLRSPFFDLDQKEKALIKNCSVQLQEVESKGSRVGAKEWDELAKIEWPSRKVDYYRHGELHTSYQAEHEPSGFTSLFAHQYTSIKKKEAHKVVSYAQSSKGWRSDYLYKGKDKNVKSKYYRKKRDAERLVTPRPEMEEKDMPTVWYTPETLGAFPLKMTMKLGVFKIEAQLKKINADQDEILQFFKEWECAK